MLGEVFERFVQESPVVNRLIAIAVATDFTIETHLQDL
jgi:hypothetical protein